MDRLKILKAAASLVDNRMGHGTLKELDESIRPQSEEEGYAVQAVGTRLLELAGAGYPVGYKVGATTRVIQEDLGISTPCFARMFSSSVWHNSHTFRAKEYRQLGMECEIAVVVSHDVDFGDEPVTDVSIAGATVGLEVLEHRYLD